MCCIYDEELWGDNVVIGSLMLDDNLNSGVTMGEDEFALLGKVHALMTGMDQSALSQQNTGKPQWNLLYVMSELKKVGLGNFSEENGSDCIKLRAALPKKVADLFCNAKWKVQ